MSGYPAQPTLRGTQLGISAADSRPPTCIPDVHVHVHKQSGANAHHGVPSSVLYTGSGSQTPSMSIGPAVDRGTAEDPTKAANAFAETSGTSRITNSRISPATRASIFYTSPTGRNHGSHCSPQKNKATMV